MKMSEGQALLRGGVPSLSPDPGLDQETPEPPRIKEEPEEQSITQEEEQLSLPVPEYSVVCVKSEECELEEETQDVSSEAEGLMEHSTDAENNEDDDDEDGDDEDGEGDVDDGQVQTRSRRSKRLKHQCPFCNKMLSSKLSLKTHIRIHTGDTPYCCSLCDKAFCFESKLKLHMRAHTGEKPFRCPTCKAAFAVKNALKVHMRIHTGEKPYHCSHCVKTFTYKITYDRHMETHTRTTQFSCSFCSRTFEKRSEFTAHIKTHRRGITFSGFTCQMDFTDSSVNEQATAESEEEPCDSKEENEEELCNSKEENKDELCDSRENEENLCDPQEEGPCEPWLLDSAVSPRILLHTVGDDGLLELPQIKEEPEEQSIQQEALPTDLVRPGETQTKKKQFSCSFCSRTFPNRKELNAHIKTHRGGITFNGFICQMDFTGFPSLSPGPGLNQTRIKEESVEEDDGDLSERKEKCPICQKKFGRKDVLRRHIKAHSGDLYSCSICNKAFTRKYTLRNHLRLHAAKKLMLMP